MGITGTIGTVIIGIIVLLIIIIAIAVFLVKVLAQIFVGLIILTVGVGVRFWLYGKMKTRI
ncbi:MAG: hypothetical protein WBL88_02195 [Nitrososphaeraceae archaeon]